MRNRQLMSSPYSKGYYESIREDSQASAREAVPIILGMLPAKSVVDVGCGPGVWARAYADAGCAILGVDGSEVRVEQLAIPAERFTRRDLSQPFQLERRFDLVNCLEVAEHLPGSRADGFVADLVKLGDLVVFSAAVPGQGGTHHVNEQWPSYWIPKFEKHGFAALDCIRPLLWQNTKIAYWYAQNLFAFVKRERLADFPAATAANRPWATDLVHPRAFVRATVPELMSPRMLKEVARALPHFPGQILRHLRGGR
jgi:SAM-dependent methyltransferase